MPQTAVQKSNAVRFGSAKLELGVDIGSLVNFGALREVKITEQWEDTEVKSDNAGVLKHAIRNQKLQATAGWLEWDTARANTLRGGIDTLTSQDGAPVADYNQVVASGSWHFDQFIPFTYQNGSGAKITPDSVTGSVDGVLVLNTDYWIVKASDGTWGISIRDSATVTTEAQNITIVFDYTPAVSKTLKSGGKYTINPRVLRITNVNEAGKKFEITIYRGFNQAPLELPFPADDGEDGMVVPIGVLAELDTSRTAGDQLYQIVDEQSVT